MVLQGNVPNPSPEGEPGFGEGFEKQLGGEKSVTPEVLPVTEKPVEFSEAEELENACDVIDRNLEMKTRFARASHRKDQKELDWLAVAYGDEHRGEYLLSLNPVLRSQVSSEGRPINEVLDYLNSLLKTAGEAEQKQILEVKSNIEKNVRLAFNKDRPLTKERIDLESYLIWSNPDHPANKGLGHSEDGAENRRRAEEHLKARLEIPSKIEVHDKVLKERAEKRAAEKKENEAQALLDVLAEDLIDNERKDSEDEVAAAMAPEVVPTVEPTPETPPSAPEEAPAPGPEKVPPAPETPAAIPPEVPPTVPTEEEPVVPEPEAPPVVAVPEAPRRSIMEAFRQHKAAIIGITGGLLTAGALLWGVSETVKNRRLEAALTFGTETHAAVVQVEKSSDQMMAEVEQSNVDIKAKVARLNEYLVATKTASDEMAAEAAKTDEALKERELTIEQIHELEKKKAAEESDARHYSELSRHAMERSVALQIRMFETAREKGTVQAAPTVEKAAPQAPAAPAALESAANAPAVESAAHTPAAPAVESAQNPSTSSAK